MKVICNKATDKRCVGCGHSEPHEPHETDTEDSCLMSGSCYGENSNEPVFMVRCVSVSSDEGKHICEQLGYFGEKDAHKRMMEYRNKLKMLLEALECQNIEDLIEKSDERYLIAIGKIITLNAKEGSKYLDQEVIQRYICESMERYIKE